MNHGPVHPFPISCTECLCRYGSGSHADCGEKGNEDIHDEAGDADAGDGFIGQLPGEVSICGSQQRLQNVFHDHRQSQQKDFIFS